MQSIAEDNATDLDTAVLFADTHKTEHAKDDVGHAVVDDHGFPASGNTSLLKVVLECSLIDIRPDRHMIPQPRVLFATNHGEQPLLMGCPIERFQPDGGAGKHH